MRFFLLLLFLFSSSLCAQSTLQDSSMFDFWVGQWDLTWKDLDGSTAKGKNIVAKILDGKVILETFSALSGQSKGFKGQSFSLLDRRSGQWKQTWVDNQESYLPFSGGMEGNTRYFFQEFKKNGSLVQQKMVFRNITADSFIWDWMNSADSGKSWNVAWSISYQRIR